MKQCSILFYNTAHCRGYNGSLLGYVSGWANYYSSPKRVDSTVSTEICEMIAEEDPTVCCFAELKEGSAINSMLHPFYPTCDVTGKYGKSYMGYFPWSKGKGNGFYAKDFLAHKKHWMPYGTKRLVHEVQLTGKTSLFFTHFALGKAARLKQFAYLAKIMDKVPSAILTGDFNIASLDELDVLTKGSRLRLVSDPKQSTFPACLPQRALDLFLCTPDIDVQECRVITSMQRSDHLPVLLKCQVS